MEYSTSRDIGQTRSRSAKMMGECPLETRPSHRRRRTPRVQHAFAATESRIWRMDKLGPQLRSPIERAGCLAADSKMTVLRANWSGDDTDGRHRWTFYIREAQRDIDDETLTLRSLWEQHCEQSEQLDTRDSAVIFRTRVNRVGKHTKIDTKPIQKP